MDIKNLEKLDNIPDDACLDSTTANAKKKIKDKVKNFEKVIKEVTPKETKQSKTFSNANLKKLHLSEDIDDLDESILNESFSPTMPQWLKKRLIWDSIKLGKGDVQSRLDREKGYENRGYNFSNIYYPDNSYLLNQVLWLANIDLQNAEFVTAPIPQNARDPILKNPDYLLIFHVLRDKGVAPEQTKEQIYIKGINDNDKFWSDDKGNDIPFKYQSMKTLLAHTVDFCYVDKSDPKNVKDISLLKNDRRKEQDNFRDDILAGQERNISRRNGNNVIATYDCNGLLIDKSGYLVDPKKYLKKLISLGRQDQATTIQKLYDRIENLKKMYLDVLVNLDPNVSYRYDEFKTIFINNSMLRDFDYICTYYQEACNLLDLALQTTNTKMQGDYLDSVFGSKDRVGLISEIYTNIKRAEADINKYRSISIDPAYLKNESLNEETKEWAELSGEDTETVSDRNTLWNRVYQELAGDKQDPPFLVKAPLKSRYGYEKTGINLNDSNIVVYGPTEESLDLAKRVANFFNLDYEVQEVLGNKDTDTAYQITIIIPEELVNELPKLDVEVSNIVWDLEDDADDFTADDLDLPRELNITVPVAVINNKQIKQAVRNTLQDEYGYTPVNFKIVSYGELKHAIDEVWDDNKSFKDNVKDNAKIASTKVKDFASKAQDKANDVLYKAYDNNKIGDKTYAKANYYLNNPKDAGKTAAQTGANATAVGLNAMDKGLGIMNAVKKTFGGYGIPGYATAHNKKRNLNNDELKQIKDNNKNINWDEIDLSSLKVDD